MRRLWQNYSLSIVLLVLFLLSWLAHGVTGWYTFVNEQMQHQSPAHFWGSDGYVWRWSESTFENWQSEFLQLLTMVAFTAWFIHKGSAESRDSADRMEAKLDAIKRALTEDEAGEFPKRKSTPRNQWRDK